MKKCKAISIFFIIVIIITIFVFVAINPIITNVSLIEAERTATRLFNQTILSVSESQNLYDELIDINTDNQGKVAYMVANTQSINVLSRKISSELENRLQLFSKTGIKIPIGTFTGLKIFSGVGPNVKVNISQLGSILCDFSSEIISGGINQTLHKIYVTIGCELNVIMPITIKKISITTNILLCESIIVGEVPQVIFDKNMLTNN